MTHNLKEQPSSLGDRYCLSVKSRKVLVAQVSVGCFKSKKRRSAFFPTKKPEKLLQTSYVRGPNFNGSSTNAVFLFKKLIVSTPGLLQGLHMMSLMKSVSKGLNPQECKQTKLREPLPVPYIPKKDKVQEEVEKL